MKILLVDDDPTIVDVIRDTIHWDKLGIQTILTAHSAPEARALLQRESFDIVLCDIEMPQETGLELLEWYQAQHMKGKFLLLTAHESFSYARQALQLQAADYLLKPFHVDAVELVLQKNIALLQKERQDSHQLVLGQWVMDHLTELKQIFFESLLRGNIHQNSESIAENIRIRHLDLSPEAHFRLAAVRITGFEQDQEQYGSDTLRYMFGNLLAETIVRQSVSERVICYEQGEQQLIYYVICDPAEDQVLVSLFGTFLHRCHELLDSTVTCCIGDEIPLERFHSHARQLSKSLRNQVSHYGQVFLNWEESPEAVETSPILQMEQLRSMFEGRRQKQLMDEMKRVIENRLRLNKLDEQTLRILRMEFQQAAYSYLSSNGIMVSFLMNDQELVAAAGQAERSPIDFLRYANLLAGKAFVTVEDVQKSKTLVAQIDTYIQEHYAEPIGRNEIGLEFHMVPEYLAKIYKKKTGKTIKDSINEYRVYQAGLLLEQTDMRIIDIAMETGFDNASYFSTIFKKYSGKSPADYRKRG